VYQGRKRRRGKKHGSGLSLVSKEKKKKEEKEEVLGYHHEWERKDEKMGRGVTPRLTPLLRKEGLDV